jgi:TRAP-type C4-dicarboxylate transport system substrate-binding protein
MRLPCAILALALVSVSARADSADPVELKLGTLAVDGSRYMIDILALSKEIRKRTRGGVELSWSSGGQLGDDAAMAKLVATGKLDGGGFSETGLLALEPQMAVWRYPGLFQSYDEVDRATAALDASVREQFRAREMVFVMWADLGFSHVFSSELISSVREMLVRAAPWITMPLDGSLTEAVASGQAKAWALPPLFMLAMGHGRARAMSNLRYRYVVGGLVLSRAAWAKLSERQQEIVLEVCREWQPRLRERWRKETERGVAALAKSGVKLHVPSAAELATFAEASAKSRTAHAKSAKLDALVDRIVAATRP